MAQISLYIEDSVAERLSIAAKLQNCSISKYVSSLILDRLSCEAAEEKAKIELLRGLRGAIDDPTFCPPADLPMVAEPNRRYDLL
jgi:hypothetical protein